MTSLKVLGNLRFICAPVDKTKNWQKAALLILDEVNQSTQCHLKNSDIILFVNEKGIVNVAREIIGGLRAYNDQISIHDFDNITVKFICIAKEKLYNYGQLLEDAKPLKCSDTEALSWVRVIHDGEKCEYFLEVVQ